ncbi:Glycosyltransferase [Melia azedarach]|uniref:Glycosyltransferase n=1 Tax=Melia azedarach TaxID=155640 RepID=A0ACC1YSL1_MELAZ|nr:Glycosyltransferase [Melia azedarach]
MSMAQNQKILKWLNDQPKSSVVFLCFGSFESFGVVQVKERAIGLENGGRIPGRDQGKRNGMSVGFTTQVEVLVWNSILERLWYGVAIATWPIYAEQQINAFRMAKELGLAMEMRLEFKIGGDFVMANEIELAMRSQMGGEVLITR